MYKNLGDEIAELDVNKCVTALRKIHPYLTKFLTRETLRPNVSEQKLFVRKNVYMQTILNDSWYTPDYIKNLICNLSEEIIHQMRVSELHWFRTMATIIATNFSNTMYALEYSISDANLILNNNNKKYSLSTMTLLPSKYILRIINNAKNNKMAKNLWKDIEPGQYFFSLEAGEMLYFQRAIESCKINNWFPFKMATASESKANVYLDDVLIGLSNDAPAYYDYIKNDLKYLLGMSNDQACSLIMSHCYLWHDAFIYPLREYRFYCSNRDLVKSISDFSKMCGVAINPHLNFYVEGDALEGRGVIPCDLTAEFNKLTSGNSPIGENIKFEKGIIYKRALALFNEAMPTISAVAHNERERLFLGDIDEYFKNRHVNCVNGAHHLTSENDVPDLMKGIHKTRMAWLESIISNPMFKSAPIIEATLSNKSEAPKNRSIKSQDSVSYLCEDWLAKGFEKYWTHIQVLIDPSLVTKEGEAERIANMLGDEYVMLDFKAMDMQHALSSLSEVTDAMCDFMGLSDEKAAWFRAAENNQYIRHDGKRKKITWSLLTGRRTTTLRNTILNYIYVNIGLDAGNAKYVSAFFVGDDVVLRCASRDEARKCLFACINSKNTFNVRKQSWGQGAEFLRHAIYKNYSYGYINRSIASFVCGSWVKKLRLVETDVPSLFQRYSWTMDNRARTNGVAALLLSRCLSSRCKISVSSARSICNHTMAINGGPVTPFGKTVSILNPHTKILTTQMEHDWPSHATDAYLQQFDKLFNEQLNNRERATVHSAFKTASYSQSIINGYEADYTSYSVVDIAPTEMIYDRELIKKIHKGIVSQHPTLPSLKGILDNRQLRLLSFFMLEKSYEGGMSLDEWLFGTKPVPIVTTLGINFDDACQLGAYPYFKTWIVVPRFKVKRYTYY